MTVSGRLYRIEGKPTLYRDSILYVAMSEGFRMTENQVENRSQYVFEWGIPFSSGGSGASFVVVS